jgi:hypothetical protein
MLSDEDIHLWQNRQNYYTDKVYNQVETIPRLYEDITYFSSKHAIPINKLLYRIKTEFEQDPFGDDHDAILAWQMIQQNDYSIPVEIEKFEDWEMIFFGVTRTFNPSIPPTKTDPDILTKWQQTNHEMTQQISTTIQESPDLRT